MESSKTTEDHTRSLLTRLAGPSTNKAGLQSVDKEKVNKIIYEVSKGSAFFENEVKRDAAVTEKINSMLSNYEKIKTQDLTADLVIVDTQLIELDQTRDLSQHICHIDMDAFYASVEERDRPELKSKPMAVGSLGMLTTANYEARKYGVRSAMPGYIAMRLCPQLIIVPNDFAKYTEVSGQIRRIFEKYDPDFSPMSLDEYVSTSELTVEAVIEQIRDEIFRETGLTASAGIAANKMLAKICSDINKPNGQYLLPNDRYAIMEFIAKLPVRKISGIGRVTERILEALEVKTCGDIYTQRGILYKLLSPINFGFLLRVYLGIGSTKIESDGARKSISVERTFSTLSKEEDLYNKLKEIAMKLADDLKEENLKCKTITIKLKMPSFQTVTRSKTICRYIQTGHDIFKYDAELPVSLRLMGLRASSFISSDDTQNMGLKRFFSSIPPSEMTSPSKKAKTYSASQENELDRDGVDLIKITTNDDYACPVCTHVLKNIDNTQFNAHIDICLNTVELKTILTTQSVSGTNEPQHSPSPKPTATGSSSLLNYFGNSSRQNPG
ncbi:DNA-directed polymerase kappa [Jimgerdemannia flammicorona]|uniref:DNA polymerase kappa n=1 Tax=Jimgerdemannia flammicorona TaxID=994334 RepID=A0A433QM80_9FUNG|nr:DNA-directed polymerase kappa [Jimgerdemannia flammicorona]